MKLKKTKFNKKELTIFSSVIKDRLSEQRKQLKSVSTLLKDHADYMKRNKNDNDHDASTLRNEEMLLSMKRRAVRKIRRLEEAQQRIENKTYGRCHKTGKMISQERLLVLPEARLSMAGKRMG